MRRGRKDGTRLYERGMTEQPGLRWDRFGMLEGNILNMVWLTRRVLTRDG